MPNSNTLRRNVGNLLLGGGLIILLGLIGYFGWTQVQAARLRAELRQTAGPTIVATASPTASVSLRPTLTPAAPTPNPTAAPPTATLSPVAVASATGAAAENPTATPVPPTATPAPPAPTATVAVAAAAPVRLLIPDLKVDTRVVPMGWEVVQTSDGPRSEWVIPKDEAGHHINSALLGQPGNLVISGHNNIYGMVFRPISFAWDDDRRIKVDNFTDRSEVLNGRRVQLYDEAGNLYEYAITEFYRLKDTGVPLQQRIANGRFMEPTADTRLTIITCWPPTNNTHRLIVIAAPVQ